MEHSEHFDEVRAYYDTGAWKIERVRNAVGRWVTETEYEEITGERYVGQ